MKTVAAMKTTTTAAVRECAGCRWGEELHGGLGVFS